MVNCKNCGAPLSLEDAVCPHCGTPNPEAQEHLKKLKDLDRKFQSARFEVVDEVKKSKKGYGLLVILVMILLANLFLIPVHSASYEIAERIIASRMSVKQIRDTMDTFLEDGSTSNWPSLPESSRCRTKILRLTTRSSIWQRTTKEWSET